MNILITGISGYIGEKLARRLVLLGHVVTGITRHADKVKEFDFPVSLIIADLINSDVNDLDISKFDIIYNCAGELRDESLMHLLHVESSMKLLSSISNKNTRWVQLSSVGVYGQSKAGEVFEDYDFSPVGSYEITKADAEVKIKSYCEKNNIQYSILRPSNVFSDDMPNQSLRKLVSFISTGFFFYVKDPVKVMTNYVHVDDVISALILCGFDDRAINEDFIISDCLSQKEFVKIICDLSGVSGPRFILPYSLARFFIVLFSYIPFIPDYSSRLEAISTTTIYSTDKIEKKLGYEKQNPLGGAIKEFYSKNKIK